MTMTRMAIRLRSRCQCLITVPVPVHTVTGRQTAACVINSAWQFKFRDPPTRSP